MTKSRCRTRLSHFCKTRLVLFFFFLFWLQFKTSCSSCSYKTSCSSCSYKTSCSFSLSGCSSRLLCLFFCLLNDWLCLAAVQQDWQKTKNQILIISKQHFMQCISLSFTQLHNCIFSSGVFFFLWKNKSRSANKS